MLRRNRRDTSEQNGNLQYQVLMDSPICLDLAYFQPIHNTFQIRGDKTQRQQNSSKTK